MELKVFKDTLTAAGTLCSIRAELPVETEILIPDYMPQVFKVIKCFLQPVNLQKQITGSRLVLDGYFRCVVFYQAEQDQSLCQTEQKIPFTKTLDLPAGEYPGYHVHVTGEVEYLNCRAVNQRRLDVRGAYAAAVSVSAQNGQEVITALTGEGIQQKTELLQGETLAADLDKLITAEENVHFPQQPAAVLDVSAVGAVQEVRVVSGKAIVKGEITAQILYRTEAGCETQLLTQAVPFHQITDLNDVAENSKCFACVEPIGCTMLAGGEPDAPSRISVTALLHLRALCGAECCVVTDSFSTRCQTEVTCRTVAVDHLEATLEQQLECRVADTLPDEGARILQCFATPAPLELVQQEQQVVLRGHATAHVFCLNSLGEIECYDKPFEFELPGCCEGVPEDYRLECWTAVSQASARRTGTEVEAVVTIRVEGMLLKRRRVQVVEQVTCGEPLECKEPDVALRICYASAGQNVFDIAKQYHVSPAAVLQSNRLDAPQLDQDACLLVPITE